MLKGMWMMVGADVVVCMVAVLVVDDGRKPPIQWQQDGERATKERSMARERKKR